MNVKRKLIVIVLIVSMFCGVIAATLRVHADGSSAGTGGGPNGGSCAPEGSTSWNDTCFGYTWRKGTVTSNSIYFQGTAHTPGGTLNDCVTVGAPVYFRLGMEKYNPSIYRNGGSANAASLGYHVGAIKRSVAGAMIRNDIDGTYDDQLMRWYFSLAAREDDDGDNNTIKGLTFEESASFCWDPGWERECLPDDPYYPTCVPPEPERPTPDPASGDGHFWSKSVVTAVAGGDVIPGITAATEIDGEAEIMFSTDQESVQIQFEHYLGFDGIQAHRHPHVTDIYGTATTEYDVTMTQTGESSTTEKTSSFGSLVTGAGATNQYNFPITVNLQPGDTKKVCQTIAYHKKNFNIPIVATYHKQGPMYGTPPTPSWEEDQHEFGATYLSGSGNSYVCATITRPAEPSGSGPRSTGTADSTIMFTGEDAGISWDTYATSYLSRRLLGWQAITYLVPVSESRWEPLTTGTLNRGTYMNITGGARNTSEPCSWYRSRGSVITCTASNSGDQSNFIHNDTDEMEKSHSYAIQKQVLIPNQVGYKYCNSFGYHYAYYWYSSNTGQWQPYPGQNYNYWNVYDATCRTIAKKPSTTIWNGSLMTAGGTMATPAYRYDGANFGETASGQARTLYGSWSEFLAVVGQKVQGVASGSNMAIGSKRGGNDICNNTLSASNSTLTISDTSCGELGYSGVRNNSTFVTRLDTYLKSGASNASHYYISNTDELRNKLAEEGISIGSINKTIVIHASGDFNITQNILTKIGEYKSIYEVPQVIIFADGNVNVSSAVTQIDAWIITPNGTVNSCSDFALGVTEADAVGRSYSLCTNQLVFNGPVLAKNLNLRRSYGSDPMITYHKDAFQKGVSTKEAPGEIFNLRSDVYLWGYAQAGRYDSSYTESYTRELAPRY